MNRHWNNYLRDPRNYFGRSLILKAGPSKIRLGSEQDQRLSVSTLTEKERQEYRDGFNMPRRQAE